MKRPLSKKAAVEGLVLAYYDCAEQRQAGDDHKAQESTSNDFDCHFFAPSGLYRWRDDMPPARC
jgi:hypothetical protein